MVNRGLLVVIRSLFVVLTHLKIPPDAIAPRFFFDLEILNNNNDLFFSGQVAFSFLGYLVFNKSPVRYVFLALSIVAGITSLLMHRHYTIDIISAYFITYGTYKLGKYLFAAYNK